VIEVFAAAGSLLLGAAVFLLVRVHHEGIWRVCRRGYASYIAPYRLAFDRLFMPVHLPRFAVIHLGSAVALVLLAFLATGAVTLSAMLGALVYFLPRFVLWRREKKRRERLDLQVMDALGLVANALKAGLTLPQAFENAARQISPPISEELSLMLREYRLGVPLDDALENMSRRITSTNLSIFVSAILISRRTGGNVAEVLETMSSSMKEIFRLEGKIDAMTSQGKAQGLVLGMLPIALGVILYYLDPTMIVPLLTTPQGYAICSAIVVSWAIGLFFIWKIISVEV
jgi:tight adherence protein B